MKTNHFLSFLAIFAVLFAISCSSDDEGSSVEPSSSSNEFSSSSGSNGGSSVGPSSSSNEFSSSSGSNGGNIGVIEPLNKFEAKPASEIGNAKIKYSYSYGGYDFYYIYLGELKNIPLFSYTTQYHDGTKTTYTVSNTETIKESVAETITNSSETTIDVVENYTTSGKSPRKVSEEIGIKIPFVSQTIDFLVAKASGEKGWEEYTNNKTSSFHQTTSLTNTITTGTEYTKTNLISRSWDLDKGDKVGYYRYTLFSTSDVYLYVIKDATGAIYYEFKECVIPDVYFWRFDYSETSSFRKSDATSFEFDISMLNNLPKPEISLSPTSNGLQPVVSGGVYNILNFHSQKAIDVEDQSKNSGAAVHIWDRGSQNSQKWEASESFDSNLKGYFTFKNVNSGKYLDVSGGNVNNNLQQHESNATNSQWFKVEVIDAENGIVYLSSKLDEGYRVSPRIKNQPNGTKIYLIGSYNSEPEAKWKFVPVTK